MRVQIPRVGLHEALYCGTIATLPLFAVRGIPGGISLPLAFMLLMVVAIGLRAVLTSQVPAVFSRLDAALCGYLLVALVGLIDAATPEVLFAIAKSFIYLMAYLAFKMVLIEIPERRLEQLTGIGLILGTISFGLVMLYSLYSTGSLGVLFGSFSYWTVTVQVFNSIDSVFGQSRDEFASVHVMRNSVGEAFAFYVIAALVYGFRSKLMRLGVAGVNVIFALSMFSRRALLAVCFGVFGALATEVRGVKRALAIAAMAAGVLGYMVTSEASSRLTDFSDHARAEQYQEAVQLFGESPYFGHGYGAKLSTGNYVHNFVLAGAMMMGTLGLIVTLWIFLHVVKELVLGMRATPGFQTPLFLIIPILGMMVGSTVEGIFTMTSWVALALHDVSVLRRKNAAVAVSYPGASRVEA